MPIIQGIVASSYKAGGSYESIATATGTGSVATLTFSSIPSTYKHLQIRTIARNANAAATYTELSIRFNGDTASNYAIHRLNGDGTTVAASGYASQTFMMGGFVAYNGLLASSYGVGITDILDYASTSKNKTIRSIGGLDVNFSGSVAGTIELSSGLWLSTAAVNSITIYSGQNFDTNTTFALYGIKG